MCSVRRAPQWVSTMSTEADLAAALREAAGQALGIIRSRPQVGFVFLSSAYIGPSARILDQY